MPCRRWPGLDRGKAGRADRRMDCTFAMKEVSRVQSKRAQAYQKLVERLSPKSDMAKGIFRAYWVGGAICVLGQLINDLFSYGLKWGMQSASTATSICLIFIASLPLLVAYPFVQKHFVKGVMIGAVKG